jgi:hypothetical protein
MTNHSLDSRNVSWEAAKQQGPALACAITVAAVVVVLFHAPLAPTVAGCGLALAVLFARTLRKLKSS